jgi:protein SCO1/2
MAGLTVRSSRVLRILRRPEELVLLGLLAVAAACQPAEPPKRYPLQGQVLAVDEARAQLTIKHEDIPNLMPGMTMSFPVATPALMQGRTPGELITGVLEVDAHGGRLVEIVHVGSAPLPADPNEAGMASGVLGVGDEVPDAALVDHTNARRSLSEWRGTPHVVTFTYTRCPLPNFCPLMDQNLATLQRRLADETSLRGRVKLVTITFDPEHDTPEVLAAHAERLRADPAIWTFLTGDPLTVERLAGRFGIRVLRDPQDASQITHNLRTLLVGADGRIVETYSGSDWTPEEVLSDLREIVGSVP